MARQVVDRFYPNGIKRTLAFEVDEQERARIASLRAKAAELRLSGAAGPDHVELDIVGEIDAGTADAVLQRLDAAPYADEIILRVDSRGGYFVPSFDIFAHISRHPARRKMAYLGRHCESGGLIMAMGADWRIAIPQTSIIVHPSNVFAPPGQNAPWSAAKCREMAEYLDWVNAEVIGIICYRTGAPWEVVAAEAETEAASSLDWCLRHNFIQEVRGDG